MSGFVLDGFQLAAFDTTFVLISAISRSLHRKLRHLRALKSLTDRRRYDVDIHTIISKIFKVCNTIYT